MTMTTTPHPLRPWHWLLLLLSVAGTLFLLGNVLFPFLLGALLSYLFHPLVTRMEQVGIARWLSSLLLLLLLMLIIAMALMLIVPLIIIQLRGLAQELPLLLGRISSWTGLSMTSILALMDQHVAQTPEHLEQIGKEIAKPLFDMSSNVASHLWASGRSILGAMGVSILTPIITFYMLKDWSNILKTADILIPRSIHTLVLEQCLEIDQTLSHYLHGQMNASLVLGLFYGIGLALLQLHNGFTIGFVTGICSFIPYFTLAVGGVIAVILAYLQFGWTLFFWSVLALFLLGQFVESNIVAPKLVGEKIGIHPLWMLFSILAGGALFGFIGILLAVPVAAIMGVLCRFLVKYYLSSTVYRSAGGQLRR